MLFPANFEHPLNLQDTAHVQLFDELMPRAGTADIVAVAGSWNAEVARLPTLQQAGTLVQTNEKHLRDFNTQLTRLRGGQSTWHSATQDTAAASTAMVAPTPRAAARGPLSKLTSWLTGSSTSGGAAKEKAASSKKAGRSLPTNNCRGCRYYYEVHKKQTYVNPSLYRNKKSSLHNCTDEIKLIWKSVSKEEKAKLSNLWNQKDKS